ncbi:MAG: hypothetical protein HQK53_00810 [Oligoflexia bacterium]|nr:hypothetical protein [Oligoflexia bacterium]
MIRLLSEISYKEEPVLADAIELAGQYIEAGIIPKRYEEDTVHIAMATILNCNAIVSWNFGHMVKLKTIVGVNGINSILGYRTIEIVAPTSVIDSEEQESGIVKNRNNQE